MAVTHASLTGAELHESKGVAAATSGQVYVANGSGSGTWRALIAGDIPANTYYKVTSQTLASTSGTSIDFTVPANTKRITVAFAGVSTNGTSTYLIRLGSAGSIITTNYSSIVTHVNVAGASSVTGFTTNGVNSSTLMSGHYFLSLLGTSIWSASCTLFDTINSIVGSAGGGYLTGAGVIDKVRITTVNGTDTFDAGTITVTSESF